MIENKRLFFALAVSMGILLLWSALMPAPKLEGTSASTGPHPGEPSATLSSGPARTGLSEEPVFNSSLGPFSLAVGTIRGGIKSLAVDGARILVESSPGILQVDATQPGQEPVRFHTGLEAGALVSRAALDSPATWITRKIFLPENNHNFLLKCKLQIVNESSEKQNHRLRLVAYQPVYVDSPQDKRYQEGLVSTTQEMVTKTYHLNLKPGQTRNFSGQPLWITGQGKSHVLILRPDSPSFPGTFHVEHPLGGITTGWLDIPVTLTPGEQAEWDFSLYAGPMTLTSLKAVDMEEAISFGSFSGISKFLLNLLTWSKGWLGNYGLAIIFLSIGIWVLFFPLTWSSVRMMKVMSQIQPEMERIRREHGKNPQRMNREIMELYKKHRVNPLGGCLPLLLQMPIFVSLFQVLTRSAQLRGASFLWIRDLSSPDSLVRFPSTVPFLGRSLNLLPILMVIAMFFQQRMTRPVQTALTEEQAAQQKILKWMPLFFGFLFYALPSGLVLYWVVNTTLTIVQQQLVFKVHRT